MGSGGLGSKVKTATITKYSSPIPQLSVLPTPLTTKLRHVSCPVDHPLVEKSIAVPARRVYELFEAPPLVPGGSSDEITLFA